MSIIRCAFLIGGLFMQQTSLAAFESLVRDETLSRRAIVWEALL